MKKALFTFFAFLLSMPVFATDLPMDVAVLRGLDKVTGRMSTFSIEVGQSGQFGKTFIVPEACYTRPPEESPENSVFLYVFEKSLKGENIELFKGWMFSSNPALSSMEHPVYDIWVIGCEKGQQADMLQNETVEDNTSTVSRPVHTTKPPVEIDTATPADLVPSQVEMEEL